MAGTSQLNSQFHNQIEIRAQGRVFFDLLRTGIPLAISLAIHLLIIRWLSFPGQQTNTAFPQKEIVRTYLNVELTRPLVNKLASPTPNPPQAKVTKTRVQEPLTEQTNSKSENRFLPQLIAEEIYYPRKTLSIPPQLTQDVDLSSLAMFADNTPKSVVLELFINEKGTIDKITTDLGAFDENLEGKLTDLLGQLKFSGGQIDGVTVKSRLKIEVIFLAPTGGQQE